MCGIHDDTINVCGVADERMVGACTRGWCDDEQWIRCPHRHRSVKYTRHDRFEQLEEQCRVAIDESNEESRSLRNKIDCLENGIAHLKYTKESLEKTILAVRKAFGCD